MSQSVPSSRAPRAHSPWQQMRVPLVVLVTVVAFGTLGFRLIENWAWLDALYMAVITLATVGFTEVHPLSESGRVFTIVLIVGGLGAVTYLVSALGRVLFEEMLGSQFWRRRVTRQIERLEGHVILCGCGRVGGLVRREIEAAGKPLLVIEREPGLARDLEEQGVLVLHGDATSEGTLTAAGITRAAGLVTALPEDAINLYVVISARDLAPNLPIVARAEGEQAEKRLLRAGATRVISPNRIGGRAMAQALLQPEVLDFLSFATARPGSAEQRQELTLQIEQVVVAERSALAADAIRIAQMRERHRVFVVAMRRRGEEQFDMPTSDRAIEAGDTLIVVGRHDDCHSLNRAAHSA